MDLQPQSIQLGEAALDVISGGYSLTLLQPKTGQPIPGSEPLPGSHA